MSDTLPVIKGKYVPSREKKPAAKSRLNAHFKYNQYRKMGEHELKEDRYIFSADDDHVQRGDAVNDVIEHGSFSVLYHKIILSPGDHEHIEDYHQWTRDIMGDLQAQKGIQLHWYGVVQAHPRENTDTPHVHLVLAGAGEDLQTGKKMTVRMDKEDYSFLREQGREHSNYEFYQELGQELDILTRDDVTAEELDYSLEVDR